MIHRVVHQLQKEAVAVSQSCRLLGVSRSGYYASRGIDEQPKACPTRIHVQASFAGSGKTYGSRRVAADLQDRGVQAGRFLVRRLMREAGLRPVWRRKFVHTTNSQHDHPVAANLLNRQFNPPAPNLAWAADITYIRTRAGWLYLAVVLDLFSRKVIGWAMAKSMPAELVCRALRMAIQQRAPAPGLIVHTDRGSQYAGAAHQALLTQNSALSSMSRVGNCWDNAVAERFFLSLKMERVWQRDYANAIEAERDVTDYIVRFYNDRRLNSRLDNQSPNAYEMRQAA